MKTALFVLDRLFPEYLDENSVGGAVRFLQGTLRALHCATKDLIADGVYTPGGETVKSVKRLQRRAGLRGKDVDGRLGKKTRESCRKNGIFDFDAIPVSAGSGEATKWYGPEHEGYRVWPIAA